MCICESLDVLAVAIMSIGVAICSESSPALLRLVTYAEPST